MLNNVLLDSKRAADFLGVSPSTLAHWRLHGLGPAFIKLTRQSVRYRAEDLEDWIESRRATSTAGELERVAP